MSRKKLMLLGGIRYLLPVIKAAHKMGVHVITADYLPDNIAHKYSDEYVNVSIIDREAVLKVAREKQIDGILSFGVDPGVVTAAYVAEQMGLPSPPLASVEILQNKDKFRDFLSTHGFNCPWHLSLDLGRAGAPRTPQTKKTQSSPSTSSTLLHGLKIPSYPCIVKPVDSAGSKGCSRVDCEADLAKAIDYARLESHNGRVIIEQFLEKVGHSSDTDSFSINNELVFCSFNCQYFDEGATNPYVPAGFTWPSDMPEMAQAELHSEIQRLIKLLNLGTSIYNIETRFCTDGKPYIMELSPRGGGNRLAEILSMATKYDLITAAVCGSLGMSTQVLRWPAPGEVTYDGSWAEVVVHANRAGVFKRLDIASEFESHLVQKDLWISPGDFVDKFTGANKTIGTLVLRFDTHADAERALGSVNDWLDVITS